ncbi:hypothetical protein Efla_000006 [Eimeria flavescens]
MGLHPTALSEQNGINQVVCKYLVLRKITTFRLISRVSLLLFGALCRLAIRENPIADPPSERVSPQEDAFTACSLLHKMMEPPESPLASKVPCEFTATVSTACCGRIAATGTQVGELPISRKKET